jgi:copper chaperone CopZ
MASHIEARDLHVGLEMAWHKLTQIPANGIITADAFSPLELRRMLTEPTEKELNAFFAKHETPTVQAVRSFLLNYKTDFSIPFHEGSFSPVGVPVNPESYTVRDIHHCFESVKNALPGVDYKVVSAGTYYDRTRYAISVEIASLKSITVGGREFKLYLTLIGSLDKTTPEVWGLTTVCVVCANTMRAALMELDANQAKDLQQATKAKGKGSRKEVSTDLSKVDGARLFARMRHSKNMAEKVALAETLVNSLIGSGSILKAQLESLLAMPVRMSEAKAIYAGYLDGLHVMPDADFAKLTESKDFALSTRRKNEVDEMAGLFARGLGNKGENGLDLLSGFTERFSRRDSFKDDAQKEKFVQSSEQGVYADRKEDFFTFLLDKPLREKAFDRGTIALERSGDANDKGVSDVLGNLLGKPLNAARSMAHA